MGRALANSDPGLPLFQDPTAFVLLPDEARLRVERARSEGAAKGLKKAIEQGYLRIQAKVMAARTLAIDDAIRVAANPQLVILGAGLDGRAWRMPELTEVTVFEIDHPDSQREKRKRVAALGQVAKDVRFVPVDFAKDDLEQALAAAGHDPKQPTTWVWEGVIMYLTRSSIEATLAVVERRSQPGSCLSVVYHSPALVLRVVGAVVRLLGEPLRSAFRPETLRSLLAKYGFEIVRDQSVTEIGRAISTELAAGTKRAAHLRIATATRR
jgi:methyltransferase (TIGR00027 family)